MEIMLRCLIEKEMTLVPVRNIIPMTIGRHPDCAIVIPNTAPYQSVSRRHAVIIRKNNAFYLCNISQRNLIRFNKAKQLQPGHSARLAIGDIFELGPVTIQVMSAKAAQDPLIMSEFISTADYNSPEQPRRTFQA